MIESQWVWWMRLQQSPDRANICWMFNTSFLKRCVKNSNFDHFGPHSITAHRIRVSLYNFLQIKLLSLSKYKILIVSQGALPQEIHSQSSWSELRPKCKHSGPTGWTGQTRLQIVDNRFDEADNLQPMFAQRKHLSVGWCEHQITSLRIQVFAYSSVLALSGADFIRRPGLQIFALNRREWGQEFQEFCNHSYHGLDRAQTLSASSPYQPS